MGTDDLNIPKPYAFYPYSLSKIPWIVTQTPSPRNITCLVPTKQSFGYGPNDLFVFPQNCGMGFINLRYTQGDNGNSVIQVSGDRINDLAIFCAACRPGYQAVPINTAFYPEIKVECNAIQFCSVGS